MANGLGWVTPDPPQIQNKPARAVSFEHLDSRFDRVLRELAGDRKEQARKGDEDNRKWREQQQFNLKLPDRRLADGQVGGDPKAALNLISFGNLVFLQQFSQRSPLLRGQARG